MKKLNYNGDVLFTYRRKKIVDENHVTRKRNIQDLGRLLKEEHIVFIFRRIIDYLVEREVSYLGDGRRYLFYSRQYDIGLIVNIKNYPSKPQIFIETWLRDIAGFEKEKSITVDPKSFYILNQKCWDYLFNIADNPKIKKNKGKKNIEKLIINDYDNNKTELDVMCMKGKVWQMNNIEICEVH